MNYLFVHGERINLSPYYYDLRVIQEAAKVAQSNNFDGRTVEQKKKDCENGYALQYAVFDALRNKGINVTEAMIKEYDLVAKIKEDTLYIDVKGIFKPDARTYSQSEWEYYNVSLIEHDIIYLCFDCRSGEAIYDGWTTQDGFRPSNFYKGGAYIFANELDK